MKEKEIKSIKIAGIVITKHNYVSFCRSNPYEQDCLKAYLTKRLNPSWPVWRPDHWAADGSYNTYQVGDQWITIGRDDRAITDAWEAEA